MAEQNRNPEQKARDSIDALLQQAGWTVRSKKKVDFGAGFTYDGLIARDKTSLDFWLKDKSLTDLDNLPTPDDLAQDVIENLEPGLESFRQVLAGLGKAG